MELTFEKSMELLEITDISKVTIQDIAAIEKKAKKRWHPDHVSHLNDQALTNEYTLNFKQLEPAGEMITAYLQGTYQAGDAFTQTGRQTHDEPEDIIRQNAPDLQATLRSHWGLIKEKKYKWHEEDVIISQGYKFKDILQQDFKEDIAVLSIVSLFYGTLSLGLLSVVCGWISPVLSLIVNIAWGVQALSCIIGFLPLSRFWLPEPVQDVVFKFINFGLTIFNWAEVRGLRSNGPWVSLLVRIPVLFAKLVKYVILFPLYEIAKLVVGGKLVGVVKRTVNYYAGAAEWYVDELINMSPADMKSEELVHLSALYSELSDVRQKYPLDSSDRSSASDTKTRDNATNFSKEQAVSGTSEGRFNKHTNGSGNGSGNSYPMEERLSFIKSCMANGNDKVVCSCLFEKIQSRYTYEEFAELGAQIERQQTPKAFMDFIGTARIECLQDIIKSNGDPHVYPEIVKEGFISNCIKSGGDDTYCRCIISKIQEKYTLEEFSVIEVQMQANQMPDEFREFINAAGVDCVSRRPQINNDVSEQKVGSGSFSRRNMILAGALLLVVLLIIGAQKYFGSGHNDSYASTSTANNANPVSSAATITAHEAVPQQVQANTTTTESQTPAMSPPPMQQSTAGIDDVNVREHIIGILRDLEASDKAEGPMPAKNNYIFPIEKYYSTTNLSSQGFDEQFSTYFTKAVAYHELAMNYDMLVIKEINGGYRAMIPQEYTFSTRKAPDSIRHNTTNLTLELDRRYKVHKIWAEKK